MYGGFFDWDNAVISLEALDKQAEDPNLWSDQQKAQALLQERNNLAQKIKECRELTQHLQEHRELIDLAEAEGETSLVEDAERGLATLAKQAKLMEIGCLFSDEADPLDCFVEIFAGAGGTDSQDWVEILLRMYFRFCENHRFKTEIIAITEGEEAGLKSVTFKIQGHQAYGWLKTECGVHRLVRISPFNSAGKRQTSFATVWVYPVIDDSIDIAIEDKELRIDTFRSSGAGGQHVNTTDSAVRITHLPTGIVAQCQNNRSQHRNKAEAMAMLRSRLYQEERRKREEALTKDNADKTESSWGHQIRSYVMHPYQLVKDVRTGVETGNIQSVLDGELDMFIMASLSGRVDRNGV